MSRGQNKSKSRAVKVLPSIIIFIILALIALIIILNKGKIGKYSLVKIQTASGSDSGKEEEPENKMEISVGQKYLSVKKKETTEVTVLINGEEVDINEVELESSNEDILKVTEDGIVKPLSVGKAKITATKDDLTASVDLRAIIPITSMTFTATNSTIRVGKSLQMKLVAKPSDASIETLKYTSSDEDIATVNNNGIVTGVAPGNVTITVTDTYTDTSKSVKLTIRK